MAEGKIVRKGGAAATTFLQAITSGEVPYSITYSDNTIWDPNTNNALTIDSNTGWSSSTSKIAIINNSINFNTANFSMITFYGDGGNTFLGYYAEWPNYSNYLGNISPISNLSIPNGATHFAISASKTNTNFDPNFSFAQIQQTVLTYDDSVETKLYEENGLIYKTHIFPSSGSFTVTTTSNKPEYNQIDYLVIAGGGGGGRGQGGGGGGGAGGYRTTLGTSGGNSTAENKVTVTAQTYPILVGAGGAGGVSGAQVGQNGGNSSVFGIVSTGGGGGGGSEGTTGFAGQNGGSGGGGTSGTATNYTAAGVGTANQGFNGGAAGKYQTDGVSGGGGGGAGQAGFGGGLFSAGKGGDGLASSITGENIFRAGGGGGGIGEGNSSAGGALGGIGGGGRGGNYSTYNVTAGEINTGSGGGGGCRVSPVSGKNGGSGIVIIRYVVGAIQ